MASRPPAGSAPVLLFDSGFASVLIGDTPSVGGGAGLIWVLVGGYRRRPTKNPLAVSAQEVADERDVALAVR
jgi:hypothetical protein